MEKKSCFIIMPFSNAIVGKKKLNQQTLTYIYEEIIRKAVMEYKEGDKIIFEDISRYNAKTGSIIKGITQNLNSSDLVIADLTGINPNVMYELGVRHTLKRGTIIITQDITSLPSDLRDYMCLEYKFPNKSVDYNKFYLKFREDLHKTIDEIFSTNKYDSPVLDYLKGREQYWNEDELKNLKKNVIVFNYILEHYNIIQDLIKKTKIDENAVHYTIYGSLISNICNAIDDLNISVESAVLYEDIKAARSILQVYLQKLLMSEHYDSFLGKAISIFPEVFNLERTKILEFPVLNYFALNEDRVETLTFENVFTEGMEFKENFINGLEEYIEEKAKILGLTEDEMEKLISD